MEPVEEGTLIETIGELMAYRVFTDQFLVKELRLSVIGGETPLAPLPASAVIPRWRQALARLRGEYMHVTPRDLPAHLIARGNQAYQAELARLIEDFLSKVAPDVAP